MAWSGRFQDFQQEGSKPQSQYSSRNPNYNQLNSSGVTSTGRVNIRDISAGLPNTSIIGCVLTKGEVRSVASKKDTGTERYVFNFTIRDSAVDFINVTCWGGEDHINGIAQNFNIGDIVTVQNAQIQPKSEYDERFRPWTPSSLHLVANENYTKIELCSDWNQQEFSNLLHLPIKQSSDFFSLYDVSYNGQTLQGEHVNLLAVVKSMGAVRDIKTKTGRTIKKLEVKLCDQTATTFALTLWDEANINFALTWCPKEYVVFAADVKVSYDNYRKAMVGTCDSKTIFTVNPDTKEAHNLYQWAQTADLSGEDSIIGISDKDIDLSLIKDVFTLDDVKQMHSQRSDASDPNVAGIIYAYVTKFDLDGQLNRIVSIRCNQCKKRTDDATYLCTNINCPMGSSMEPPDTQAQYDVLLQLSDRTGSLRAVRLGGAQAETLIGCPAGQFKDMEDGEKTAIKWKYLMELCKVYIKTSLPTYEHPTPLVRILACEPAKPLEILELLPQPARGSSW
ncbi:PREDICTED: meiosis-specific with OB domain-containing protein-like [Priapulus caudatus]|uniref:Meiosis-specific with OB domain-containing protein-like n=1 Tax=Priapulus caudatus TaxID=37621 RepID=A0ABM1DQY6_PRICU|nr:PREDICTED: meiosis-specific with OB domain-containing protein-like [Priapulus caudatus]